MWDSVRYFVFAAAAFFEVVGILTTALIFSAFVVGIGAGGRYRLMQRMHSVETNIGRVIRHACRKGRRLVISREKDNARNQHY